ncbi:MAG: ATP-dependent DNA helicase RecG [Trueperella sp.]|nr:ATP-dependent DNA helicase RecG [Trueperella sp.]
MTDKTTAAVAAEEWTALSRPLARVIGNRSANALAKLGLHTVEDLLLHLPFRLTRRGELMPIKAVHEGESVTVVAQVVDTNIRPMNQRRGFILNVEISDGVHELELTFFAKSARPLQFHAAKLQPGTVATFSGTISTYRGQLQLTHPEYQTYADESEIDATELQRPIPIYHASAKVPSWQIHKAITTVLATITPADIPDPLPADYRQAHQLPNRFAALTALHLPTDDAEWEQAITRMKHEEAFILQALLAQQFQASQENDAPACPPQAGGMRELFANRLPFTLTASQQEVIAEISGELSRTLPTRRLLQGDVGSGKTIVALLAMLQVVDAGYQAVLVTPTEVLARQHYATILQLLGELGWGQKVELLTGSLTAGERRRALATLASGAPGITIGTHALLQEGVQLPRLGFVVVDEQHRFGVDQRDKLAVGAHLLVMTATPIPRTIAMTSFGELEVSTLRELPAGRSPITTNLVPSFAERWVKRVWQRVREEVDAGGRAYVVAPRISPNQDEEIDARASQLEEPKQLELMEKTPPPSVTELAQQLAAEPALAGTAIGVMHGRLTPAEKTAAMSDFAAGRTPVLVATTVIEVGVDVPQATAMVICGAENFGLSQLHQLRGRIGRGTQPGICLAIHSALEGTYAYERLHAFAQTTDGFELARRDLELRSEGNVLGTAQSGRKSGLRFVKVTSDEAIIAQARIAARALIAADPRLEQHPQLRAKIQQLDKNRTEYLAKG